MATESIYIEKHPAHLQPWGVSYGGGGRVLVRRHQLPYLNLAMPPTATREFGRSTTLHILCHVLIFPGSMREGFKPLQYAPLFSWS